MAFSLYFSGEVTIQPGVYNYDFQIQLPPELPTSIEGVFGYIRYVACVTIDHPVERDPYFETTFTVIKPLNLNDNPSYRVSTVLTNACMSESDNNFKLSLYMLF